MTIRARHMLLALATAAGLGPGGASKAATLDIPVVISTSGGAGFAGKGQVTTLDALAGVVNKSGGIGGQDVRFVYRDDQTSAQLTVQLTSQVLGDKPIAVLGSTLTASCRAMAPQFKNGPVHFCLSPGLHPAAGSYSFSSSASSVDQIAASVRYYRVHGWTKLATLQTTDASGQDGDEGVKTVLARPENAAMQLVDVEHYNPTDINVSAQIERIRQSGAQAMVVWATGAPVATVLKGMVQGGLDLPVVVTAGNQVYEAMTQWKAFLPPQLLIASSQSPPHAGLFTLDPRVEAAQADMNAAYAARGLKSDGMTATAWDAGLIVVAGLRRIGPNGTAQQLRDFIDNLTDFPGINGLYDFKRFPERGLGQDAAILTRYDPAKDAFVWMSKPGGEPLGK